MFTGISCSTDAAERLPASAAALWLRRLLGASRPRLPVSLTLKRFSTGTNHQRLYDFWAAPGSLMCTQPGGRLTRRQAGWREDARRRRSVIKMRDASTPSRRALFILSSATRRHSLRHVRRVARPQPTPCPGHPHRPTRIHQSFHVALSAAFKQKHACNI